MISIDTKLLSDFLIRANKIPANKFLTISDFVQIETDTATAKFTYTGMGATVAQNIACDFTNPFKCLCDINILNTIVSNGQKLVICQEGEKISLTCGRVKTSITIPEDVAYESLIEDGEGKSFTLTKELIEAIKKASIATPVTSYNMAFCNVHIMPLEDGICEVMGTDGFVLFTERVEAAISDSILLTKAMCSTINLYSEVECTEVGNKYILRTVEAVYAFNKSDENFIKGYRDLLTREVDNTVKVASFDKTILIAFCEQCLKISPDKELSVTLKIQDDGLSAEMFDIFLGIDNRTLIDATIHEAGASVTIHPKHIMPALKAIPVDMIDMYLNMYTGILKPTTNDNITTLFIGKK